jgi:NADPH2:quinone reductase
MKAIVVENPGHGPDVLRYMEVEKPQPRDGEVLIRTAAIGVNFTDVYHRTGVYPTTQRPLIIGSEAAGMVTELGSGVTGFAVGDRVAYAAHLGSYAEFVVVPAAKVVHVPEGVSFQIAAAIMLQGMTAHYLSYSIFPLHDGHVALVHAGAGGVGLLLTQLAKARGATVITTVSTGVKAALSKAAGADHVILYTENDFAVEARALTQGQGVHVVYDSVGKTTFDKSLDSLRPRGMQVLYGGSSGQVPPFDVQILNHKGSLFLTRPSLGAYIADRGELEQRANDLFEGVLRGTLKVHIGGTYPLADAARAHADLEARKTTGKLLLIP